MSALVWWLCNRESQKVLGGQKVRQLLSVVVKVGNV